MRECPLWEIEHKRNLAEKPKEGKRDQSLIPNRRLTTKEANSVVKRALAAMAESSSDESEPATEQEDQSLMAIDESDYEDIPALMAASDSDSEDGKPKVSFLDLKANIKSYSHKKLTSLSLILVDEYNSLAIERKQIMTDYASLKFDNKRLEEEQTDLKRKIEELERHAKEDQEKEKPINSPRIDSQALLIENQNLRKNLEKAKADLERTHKWTRSSEILASMHDNHSSQRQGIGYNKESLKDEPGTNQNNVLCSYCGTTGHYKDQCNFKLKVVKKNIYYTRIFTEMPRKHPRYRAFHQRPSSQNNLMRSGKTNSLPFWAKRDLIHPFTNKKGPKLIWVPKSNI